MNADQREQQRLVAETPETVRGSLQNSSLLVLIRSSKTWQNFAGFLALLLLALLVYSSQRWRFFRSDDLPWIRAVQSQSFYTLAWDQFLRGSPQEYRPLTSVHLWLLHRFFGDWATGFYLVNLLLHAGSAALVYALASRFGISKIPAAFAATLFLVHPAPYQAILWVNDAATLLQTHFTLWALLLVMRHFEPRSEVSWDRFNSFALSIVAVACAMFAKESGVTACLLPALLDGFLRLELPRSRLRRYVVHLGLLCLYLPLSLSFTPGWREHSEAYRMGLHLFPNLAYGLGFLLTTPDSYGGAVCVLTWTAGVVLLLAGLLVRNNHLGMFLACWMVLGAMPTSLFVVPGTYDTTGRYAYSYLAPFAILAGVILNRLYDCRGVQARFFRLGRFFPEPQNISNTASTSPPLGPEIPEKPKRQGASLRRQPVFLAVCTALLLALARKTSHLAERPAETHAGPILYHFVVMSLMNYREAERYLIAEIGCPDKSQLLAAARWGEQLARPKSQHPEFELLGSLVSGVAFTLLADPTQASPNFDRAVSLVRSKEPMSLARGAEVGVFQIGLQIDRWRRSPPVFECETFQLPLPLALRVPAVPWTQTSSNRSLPFNRSEEKT